MEISLSREAKLPDRSLPSLNYKHHLDDLNTLIEILTEFDLDVRSTRIQRYKRYFEALLSNEPFDHYAIFNDRNQSPIRHDLDRQLYVLREMHELMWIAKGFQKHLPIGAKVKLETVLGGRDFAVLDKNTIARDTQFELRIAAYFCRDGYEVDLSTNTDIIASSKRDSFYVECKRVASSKRVKKNLDKAAKQLSERLPKPRFLAKKAYGIIALEVSFVAYPHGGVGYGYTPDQMKVEIQNKLTEIEASWFDSYAALGNLQNILLWKQIHMPGVVMYPRAVLTRFSNLFSPYPFMFFQKKRAFSRLLSVIQQSDEEDTRLVRPEELTLKSGVQISAGTEVSWDVNILETFTKNLELPALNGDDVVMEAVVNGEKLYFSGFELKFAVANLSDQHIASIRANPSSVMSVLTGALIYWRDPFEQNQDI